MLGLSANKNVSLQLLGMKSQEPGSMSQLFNTLGKPCNASRAGPTSPVGQVLPLLLGRPHLLVGQDMTHNQGGHPHWSGRPHFTSWMDGPHLAGWVGHTSQLNKPCLTGWDPPLKWVGPTSIVVQTLPRWLCGNPTLPIGWTLPCQFGGSCHDGRLGLILYSNGH